MSSSSVDLTPQTEETLAQYVVRLRHQLNLSQVQVCQVAGIHRQSLSKIEKGQTLRLNHKAKSGLSYALGIPAEYLDAVTKGETIPNLTGLKFCPHCWIAGTAPDAIWLDLRSKYCFRCGTALCSQCQNCQEPIASLRFRFCPYCGTPYKPAPAPH